MIAKLVTIIIVNSVTTAPSVFYEDSVKNPEYCSELKSSLQDYKMDSFIKILNERYREEYSEEPVKSNEECLQSLNKMMTDCGIPTLVEQKFRRVLSHFGGPFKNKTVYESAGSIDIRTMNYSEANLVIKLRYNKRRACIPLSHLIKYMEIDSFKNWYSGKKVNLLALSFKAGGDPAIDEWISILHQDGEIMDAKLQAECLRAPEFSDLQYKNKTILEYMEKFN